MNAKCFRIRKRLILPLSLTYFEMRYLNNNGGKCVKIFVLIVCSLKILMTMLVDKPQLMSILKLKLTFSWYWYSLNISPITMVLTPKETDLTSETSSKEGMGFP